MRKRTSNNADVQKNFNEIKSIRMKVIVNFKQKFLHAFKVLLKSYQF